MSTSTPDTKPITEPMRFDLTDAEVAAVARLLNIKTQERDRNTANFDRLKADHKSRDAGFELEINDCLRKINDGFEMRDTMMEVSFNDPVRSRKTVRVVSGPMAGTVVREEAMTLLDIEQRNLPLPEEPFLFLAVFLPNWKDVSLSHFEGDSGRKAELIFSAPTEGNGIKVTKSRFAETFTKEDVAWQTVLSALGYTEAEIALVSKTVPVSREAAAESAAGPTILDGDGETAPNGVEPHPNLTPEGERTGTLSQTAGGDNAGVTDVATVLDQAAAQTPAVRVPLGLAKFASDYRLAAQAFKKAAKKVWPQLQISLIGEQISALITGNDPKAEEKAFAILAAHVCAETPGK